MVLHIAGIPDGSEVVYRHPRTGEEFIGLMYGEDFIADDNASGLVHCLNAPMRAIRVLRKPLPLFDVHEFDIEGRTDLDFDEDFSWD